MLLVRRSRDVRRSPLIVTIRNGGIAVVIGKDVQIDACLSANVGHVLRRRRHPLGALPRQNVLEIHGVDLLEGAALAFNDEEVDDEGADKVAGSKDVAISIQGRLGRAHYSTVRRQLDIPKVDGARNERGEEPDAKVPDPVARSRQSHALGTVA